MSEYEHLKGRLRKVPFMGITLEYTCEWVLKENGITPDPDYGGDPNPFEMQLRDELYRDYVIYDEDVYEVVEADRVEDYDIYTASFNSDGTISFEVCYYNGGQSFDEAVETAINKLIETEKEFDNYETGG